MPQPQTLNQPRPTTPSRAGTSDDGRRAVSTSRSIEAELGLQRTLARFGAVAEPTPVTLGADERYEIRRVLGRGAMGTVYLAWDAKLEREVAIKVVSPRLGRRARFQARLQAEANTLATLNHPNVLTVHDVQHARSGELFIVMEYVRGPNLREWAAANEPGRSELLAVLIAAGRGLEAAHQKGVVHRDFKPDNVLICADEGRVRVADFGLAVDGVAEQGVYVGTRGYMAPEQRRGDPIDARSDQYAFCVSAWELLVGQRPEPPELERPIELPRWLHARLARGLEVDRERRYPSMGVLLRSLERAPVRRKWAVSLAGAALLGGSIASAATYYSAASSRAGTEVDCSAVDRELAEVWGPPQRQRLAAALGPSAEPIIEQLEDAASRWRESALAGCREGRNVPCQRPWLERFERRVAWLAALGPEQLGPATAAIESLRRDSWCALIEAPLAPEVREDLDVAELAMDEGDYGRAGALALEALAGSEEAEPCQAGHGYSHEAGAAHLRLAEIAGERHDVDQSLAELDLAAAHARGCHDDFLLASTELRRAKILAADRGDVAGARRQHQLTRALLARSPEAPEQLMVEDGLALGLIEVVDGKVEPARRALLGARALLDDQPLLELEALINMASAAVDGGDVDTARALFRDALAVAREVPGRPPELDILTLDRGIAELADGRSLMVAKALLEAAEGSPHPSVAIRARSARLEVEWRLGNPGAIAPLARELVALVLEHPDQPSVDRAQALTWAGQLLADQGHREGLDALERALQLYEAELPDAPERYGCAVSLGMNALELGEVARARELYAQLRASEDELPPFARPMYELLGESLEKISTPAE